MSRPDHIERLADRLQQRAEKGVLSVPGCWDALTLLLLEQGGAECGFVSGAAVSMAALGLPDLGYLTGERIAQTIATMRGVSNLPLIVDGDTGFGNGLTAQAFIRSVERAGASAVQIEDQLFPKRCGHMAGKRVVPEGEAVDRIRAVLDARDSLLVVARTDALGVEGMSSAIDRAERFLEAGADIVFVEGPRSWEELEAIANRFASRVPLVHNLVEGGITPTRQGKDLSRLGFAIALHPLLLMHGLAAHAPRWLDTLLTTGSTESIEDEIANLSRMNEITRAAELLEQGNRYTC